MGHLSYENNGRGLREQICPCVKFLVGLAHAELPPVEKKKFEKRYCIIDRYHRDSRQSAS